MKFRKDNSINIKKYKNRREWNVGIVIFMIIFIYLVVTIFTYATSKKVYAYEVRKGSIVKDNSYIGLAIRQESVIKTETGGYINYYQNENSKVKAGASVYTVSDQKLKFPAKDTSEETAALSEDLQNNLILQMQQFNENYDPQKYSSVYSLKNEITALMQTSGSKTKTSQLSAVIEASGLEVTSFQTSQDGILVLTVDGYEGLTKDSFTEKDFDRSSYESI